MAPTVTDLRNAEIVMLYEEHNMSAYQIARDLGLASATVYRVLNMYGVEMRKNVAKHIDMEELIKDYKDGMKTAELAEKYGAGFYRHLAKAGVTLRWEQKRLDSDARMDLAVQLYKDGVPVVDIRDTYHVSLQTLGLELERRGIPRRNVNYKVLTAATVARLSERQKAAYRLRGYVLEGEEKEGEIVVGRSPEKPEAPAE